jgi:preprotein translocase subunit SecG
MYTVVTILIILVCVLLVLVVLVQNAKGGGLASGFTSSNQIMGVQKTTDFIEKLTWGLALGLVVLCLVASLALPNKDQRSVGSSMQEQIDNSGTPAQQTPKAAPPQQPAATQPAQPVSPAPQGQ